MIQARFLLNSSGLTFFASLSFVFKYFLKNEDVAPWLTNSWQWLKQKLNHTSSSWQTIIWACLYNPKFRVIPFIFLTRKWIRLPANGYLQESHSCWQTQGIQNLIQHIHGQDFEPNQEPPFELGARGDFQMPWGCSVSSANYTLVSNM